MARTFQSLPENKDAQVWPILPPKREPSNVWEHFPFFKATIRALTSVAATQHHVITKLTLHLSEEWAEFLGGIWGILSTMTTDDDSKWEVRSRSRSNVVLLRLRLQRHVAPPKRSGCLLLLYGYSVHVSYSYA